MQNDLIIGGLIGALIALALRALRARRASSTLDEVESHANETKERAISQAEAQHSQTAGEIQEQERKIKRAQLRELAELLNEEIPND